MSTLTLSPVSDKPATFTELLPAQKSSKSNAMKFTPSGDDHGVLTIQTARASSEYAVSAFDADGGRGFHFSKIAGGTDAEAESYDVFCGPAQQTCECKGFLRWNTPCKHIAAALALIENAWL